MLKKVEGLFNIPAQIWQARQQEKEKQAFLADRTFQVILNEPTDEQRAEFQEMIDRGEVYFDERTREIHLRSRGEPQYEIGVVNLGTGHYKSDNPGRYGSDLLWQMRKLAGWKDPSGAKEQGPDLNGLSDDTRELIANASLSNIKKNGTEYRGFLGALNMYVAIVPQQPSTEARKRFNTQFLGNKNNRIWLDREMRSINWSDGVVDRKIDLATGQVIQVATGSLEFQAPDFIYLCREWAGIEDPTGVEMLKDWQKGVNIFPERDRD